MVKAQFWKFYKAFLLGT